MRKFFIVAFSFAAFGLTAAIAGAGPLDSPGAVKSLVCSACHGPGGNSPGATVPIIAGMAPTYFQKAVKDYAEGKRPSPEMEPYSKYVLQHGAEDIAAYFAEQKKQPTRIKADPNAAKRGMATAGQCVACHLKGEGDPAKGAPDLRGQPPGFLQAQMTLFREDKRKLDDPALEEQKKKVLKSLSDKELAELAAYYSSLK
jgi:cytochrome c553